MTQETKSEDCCGPVTVSLRCEGDALVIRLEGKDAQRFKQCCCPDKGKDQAADCC